MIELQSIGEKVLGIIRSPKIEVTMYGGQNAKSIFLSHTAPHRKLRVVGNKTLGVALIELPQETGSIFKGRYFGEARRKANRARKKGFYYQKVSAIKYFDAIYSINTSASVRQNRPLDDYMVDVLQVQKFCEKNPEIYGIFDPHGKLQAYGQGVLCGEVYVLQRFIGHCDYLNTGIMFFLMFELLSDLVNIRKTNGVPLWVQHDMYFVKSAGARQFKKETGFSPYNVKWLWSDECESAVDQLSVEKSSEHSPFSLSRMPRTSR